MWIFLTAVFLVLFFLFYRHPKQMFKATGALVGLVALVILGFVLWDEYTAKERAQEFERAEAARQRESALEEERQRKQAEAAENEKKAERYAEYTAIKSDTVRRIKVESVNAVCPYSFSCNRVQWTVTVRNTSNLTLQQIALGAKIAPATAIRMSALRTTGKVGAHAMASALAARAQVPAIIRPRL
jgi:hypothetical protein